MKRISRICLFALCILMGARFFMVPSAHATQTEAGVVHIIPVEGTIDNGNWMFIQRAYNEAIAANARALIFEVNTYGGFVDPAISIKDLILHSPVPTYTFVNTRALSAGALIALAGEHLIMASGATMGAAEAQILGERADEKTMSMWVAQLSGTAEIRGRDGEVAAAMADIYTVIEGVSTEGELLTLTPLEAVDLGMADYIFDSYFELMNHFDLGNLFEVHSRTTQEYIIGFLSNPFVSALLLIIGIAGLAIEIFTAGSFGVFGVAGVLGFVLFFIGNFMAGNLGAGAILLFGAGIMLIAVEIFVTPGFGVVGIGGILAVLASVIMAAPTPSQGMSMLAISLVVSIIIIIITLKNRKTRKIWDKLALSHTEKGYTSDEGKFYEFDGKEGKAITILRPAGTAEIDGRRVDVVTSGEFIQAGSDVKVILVEGARVVVAAKNPSRE